MTIGTLSTARFALSLAETAVQFAPVVVVLVTRRPWRDTAARIAGAWAMLGMVDVIGFLRYLEVVPRWMPYAILAVLVRTTLVVPTLLEWEHGVLGRRRKWIALALTAAAIIPVLIVHTERAYGLFARPIVQFAVLALVGATLASVVRRSRIPMRHLDAFWVCLALLVSSVLTSLLAPIAESLYARDRALMRAFQSGQVLLEIAFSCIVAYAMLQRPYPRIGTDQPRSSATEARGA